MKTCAKVFSIITLTMIFTTCVLAQSETAESGSNSNATKAVDVLPQDDIPYLLKSGDNEFGGWAGISFKATTIFEGLSEAVSIGVRFHHISNGDRSGTNRGLNQFVFYAGFSVFN